MIPEANNSLIALSLGDPPDLIELGYGVEHIDVVAIRIARCLLNYGCDLSYGGIFRSQSFTDLLARVVSERSAELYERELRDDGLRVDGSRPPAPMLINYQPQGFHEKITTELIARSVGRIEYVKVDPDWSAPSDVPNRAQFNTAVALSKLRQLQHRTEAGVSISNRRLKGCQARVVLGGRVEGWLGCNLGIAEEIIYTLEKRHPLFILGGFGGAARVVATYLAGARAFPEALTFDYQFTHEDSQVFRSVVNIFDKYSPTDLTHPRKLFSDMKETLEKTRENLAKHLNNGLSEEENRDLLLSENVVTILGYLKRGLAAKKLINLNE